MSVPVRIVVLPNGEGLPLPSYATDGAAGCDLRAAIQQDWSLEPGERGVVPCGIAIELPDGFEAQVRPRSGLASKHGITVINSPGTIDSDYRGEIKVPIVNLGQQVFVIRRGERIAQMVVAPVVRAQFEVVASLSDSARGADGFGSTGR